MSDTPQKSIGPRMIVIQILLLGCLCLLGARSFEVQIFQGSDLARRAQNNYLKYRTIQGERGQILDRNENKLAASIDSLTITADPSQIKKPEQTAQCLARILKLDPKPLVVRLATTRRFTVVARDVSPELAEKVRQENLVGIYYQNDFKRVYPNMSLASQVLGFTGKQDAGLEGLEFKYNAVLTGSSAKINFKEDGAGRLLDMDKRQKEELKGNSLVLTLDKKIQFFAEKALENAVTGNRARSGMALVMRTDTGELLAMAHYPKFDPNNFGDYPQETYRNRAVTDPFEPGSAMKVFTAAAALENGFFPESIFDCENGNYKIGRYTVHDTHPHEWLSISKIIQFSSNIGAAKISETIGKEALYKYLTGFGFGDRSNVGCPGETPGTLPQCREWSKIDTGAISFGQGLSVSAVQLIAGVSAIANHGMLMKPMLIKKITSHTGKDIQVFDKTPIRQVISEETADKIKTMMNLVVEEEGTGSKAAIPGYPVCGKTGTAQKARKTGQGYAKDKYVSVFAGFAPKQSPRLAAVVVVDEPTVKYYGGEVAAPAFKEIMAQAFSYLNIPPEQESPMVAGLDKGDQP